MEELKFIAQLLAGSETQMDAAFQQLLTRWDARAIGIWKFEHDALHLIKFSAVADMPAAVSAGFQAATRHVLLTQDKLGIVNAVLKRSSVPAYVDQNLSPLRDSASWIEKFGCLSSLSVPIIRDQKITQVLAVSYVSNIQPTDKAWQEQLQLAELLAGNP